MASDNKSLKDILKSQVGRVKHHIKRPIDSLGEKIKDGRAKISQKYDSGVTKIQKSKAIDKIADQSSGDVSGMTYKRTDKELLTGEDSGLRKVRKAFTTVGAVLSPPMLGLPITMTNDAIQNKIDIKNAEKYDDTFEKEIVWTEHEISEKKKKGEDTKQLETYLSNTKKARAKMRNHIEKLKEAEKKDEKKQKIAKESFEITQEPNKYGPLARFALLQREYFDSDIKFDNALMEAWCNLMSEAAKKANYAPLYKRMEQFVMEGGLFSTEMFHGSDLKLDHLEPTAFNAGHKFRKASWSVFMWPTYDLAYKWAVFVTVRNFIKPYKDKGEVERVLGEHISTGLTSYDFKVYCHYNSYDKIKEIVTYHNLDAYVYTVNAPIDSKLGLGNSNAQPEYSYDGTLDIKSVEKIRITPEVFDKVFTVADQEKYNELKSLKAKNIRGPVGLIFYDFDEVIQRWRYVTGKVKAGEVKPGEDLDEVMKDYSPKAFESTIIVPHADTGARKSAYIITVGLLTEALKSDRKLINSFESLIGGFNHKEYFYDGDVDELNVAAFESENYKGTSKIFANRMRVLMETINDRIAYTGCKAEFKGDESRPVVCIEGITQTVQDKVRSGVHAVRNALPEENPIKTGERMTEPLDNAVNNIIDNVKSALSSDKRDEINHGQFRIKLIRVITKCIVYGGTAVLIHPAVAAILFLGKMALDMKIDAKERRKITNDLESELEIVEEKIKDADSKGDNENKYKLMRIRKSLQTEVARIKLHMDK